MGQQRVDLSQRWSCENGHAFIVEAGLVQSRYTEEVFIHCPECGILSVFVQSWTSASRKDKRPDE
jgi:hypothetical protein